MLFGIRSSIVHGGRLFHTTGICRAVDKASLSKLRKKTGFPFINCKKALEKFDNDIKQAEVWMKEEAQKAGWAKASKLADRPMSQGLIGVEFDNKCASMIEINCETDFVSRNKKFHNLLTDLSAACMGFGKTTGSGKVYLGKEAFRAVPVKDGQTIADVVAMEVGNIGENMSARRGVFMKAAEDAHIVSYVHATGPNSKSNPSDQIQMGKYGSLLVLRRTPEPGTAESPPSVEEFGRQLCQHVVGMNPQEVGGAESRARENKDEETVMIHQEYLLDTTQTVGEVLAQNGMQILDFARFECGEELKEDEDS